MKHFKFALFESLINELAFFYCCFLYSMFNLIYLTKDGRKHAFLSLLQQAILLTAICEILAVYWTQQKGRAEYFLISGY